MSARVLRNVNNNNNNRRQKRLAKRERGSASVTAVVTINCNKRSRTLGVIKLVDSHIENKT